MLGKPEWFTYHTCGWGIQARTWQGYVYIGTYTVLCLVALLLPIHLGSRIWVIGLLTGLLALDALDILRQLGRHHDERERHHQLLIERNCSFAAVTALVIAMGVQTWQHRHGPGLPFDPWLPAVLIAMGLTKALSTLYVRRKF